MNITPADYDLADRFVYIPTSMYGYGTAMGEAKISPAQLERLIKLNLIKLSPSCAERGGYCGGDALKNPGKGFGRMATSFVRTYDKRPTK